MVQSHQLGQDPPLEDPVTDELELELVVPFDFFGLGQPVIQQQQDDQEEQQDQDELEDNDNQQNQQNEQNLGQQIELQLQQPNPWVPWAPWPEVLPAQQQIQHGQMQDLNVMPNPVVGMEIDLNIPEQADPLEVIINLLNPLAGFC